MGGINVVKQHWYHSFNWFWNSWHCQTVPKQPLNVIGLCWLSGYIWNSRQRPTVLPSDFESPAEAKRKMPIKHQCITCSKMPYLKPLIGGDETQLREDFLSPSFSDLFWINCLLSAKVTQPNLGLTDSRKFAMEPLRLHRIPTKEKISMICSHLESLHMTPKSFMIAFLMHSNMNAAFRQRF